MLWTCKWIEVTEMEDRQLLLLLRRSGMLELTSNQIQDVEAGAPLTLCPRNANISAC